MQRGVKLGERERSDMKANELGNMVHEVGQIFIDELDWNCTLEQALELASDIFDRVANGADYIRHHSSEGGKLAFELIKREAMRFCRTLFEVGKNSKLKPKYLEVAFGSKKFPAITVNTRKGVMNITGKIDRVDSDGTNMTIVDYKTGKVDGAKTDVNLYTGQKLQLFLYAKAFSNNYKPIGAYYFPISNKFVTVGEKADPVLVGKTIADDSTACLIDPTITAENTKGTYINANFERAKNGDFKYKQGILSDEEFEAYMEYSQKVAGEGLAEISDGVIVASPYDGACEYCEYHGLCGYDEESDARTREIVTVDKYDIMRAIGLIGSSDNENEDKED